MKVGLVALVGRPNVGKSTLLNALLGQKLAIVSDKPQTTRSAVRGVLHRPEGQVVLVDTPGLHKPRTLLGQRLNDLVRGTLAEVDLVLQLVDAAAGVGVGDRFLAAELAKVATPKLCVVNKMDAASKAKVAAALQAAAGLADFAEVVPVSARAGTQLDLLVIRAFLFVERASQKPIVLGKGGSVLRDIGTRARAELEALFGTQIYLDLRVKVAKEWQRDPRQLSRLGF